MEQGGGQGGNHPLNVGIGGALPPQFIARLIRMPEHVNISKCYENCVSMLVLYVP